MKTRVVKHFRLTGAVSIKIEYIAFNKPIIPKKPNIVGIIISKDVPIKLRSLVIER